MISPLEALMTAFWTLLLFKELLISAGTVSVSPG